MCLSTSFPIYTHTVWSSSQACPQKTPPWPWIVKSWILQMQTQITGSHTTWDSGTTKGSPSVWTSQQGSALRPWMVGLAGRVCRAPECWVMCDVSWDAGRALGVRGRWKAKAQEASILGGFLPWQTLQLPSLRCTLCAVLIYFLDSMELGSRTELDSRASFPPSLKPVQVFSDSGIRPKYRGVPLKWVCTSKLGFEYFLHSSVSSFLLKESPSV